MEEVEPIEKTSFILRLCATACLSLLLIVLQNTTGLHCRVLPGEHPGEESIAYDEPYSFYKIKSEMTIIQDGTKGCIVSRIDGNNFFINGGGGGLKLKHMKSQ